MILKGIFTLLLIASVCADFPPEVVQTEYGPVKGYQRLADEDIPYMSYRGVPYSAQPVGDLRFKPLQAPELWTEPFDAVTEGPVCPQNTGPYGILFQPQGMDEACIHVNIHVPITSGDTSGNLPVYVFFHGGSFIYGSGDSDYYGPEYLVTRDVILVTFNYRLDVLGLLALGTAEAPGNLSLKDIVFLLEWVQRNIARFGGDPDNVTVGGHSAGGVAAHLLTLSPLGEGLFQRAIPESGVAGPVPMPDIEAASQVAISLATSLSIDNSSAATIISGLKEKTWEELIEATGSLSANFAPVVENVIDGVEAFLTEQPFDILTSGNARCVPQLIGMTNGEGGTYIEFIKNLGVMTFYAANPSLMVPDDIAARADATQLQDITNKIVDRYFDGNVTADSASEYARFIGEQDQFAYTTIGETNAQYLPGTTHLYLFSFVGENNYVKYLVSGANFTGAVHGDDLCYEFRVNGANRTFVPGSTEEFIRNVKLDYWTSFIKTGYPSTTLLDLEWPETDESMTYLSIDDTLTVETYPLADVKQFFDDIYASLE